MDELELGLAITPTINWKSTEIQTISEQFLQLSSDIDKARAAYTFVRDFQLYDPYHLDLRPEALIASGLVNKKRAWCVEKSVLLCAVFRALGLRARLGFGIVKNHIGVEKLVHYLRREEIVFHGFTEVYLDGRWVKCTPAFDQRICKLSGVEPLEWNGSEDSLLQPYRTDKRQFMEYLHFYGSFYDVPFELMHAEMKKYYPHLFIEPTNEKGFSFNYSKVLSQ